MVSFFLNWNVIILLCFVSVCHKTTWINHIKTVLWPSKLISIYVHKGMCTGLWCRKYFLLKVMVQKNGGSLCPTEPWWSSPYLPLHRHLIHGPPMSLCPSLTDLHIDPQSCCAHLYWRALHMLFLLWGLSCPLVHSHCLSDLAWINLPQGNLLGPPD